MNASPAFPAEQLAQSLTELLDKADRLLDRLDALLPQPLRAPDDWGQAIAWRYRRHASGGGVLEAVQHMAAIALEDLIEVGAQKDKLVANTAQFVAGRPANNVLLTGARGTGKSSLVRACLHHFAPQGLRLIEVDKDDLIALPDIAAAIGQAPWRFIIYSDDLSFDEGERGYKALKSILDGSIAAASPNMLVYATSNRRHLLPEYMSDNQSYRPGSDGEIHPGEGVEEKISLSERFGLWISFYPFSQDEYLAIAAQWLRHLGCPEERLAHARQEALVWALERGSRSGRVAYQFARDYVGRDGADGSA
ncbi:MAG: ATP-binding protein [Comamonadaceae bacterium]|nr:ATP-binding protein [Comamonadaceae bacterium]